MSLAAVVLALVSCGGSGPQAPSRETPVPTPSGTVIALKVSGPATIAPGASAQFVATAQLSDGSTQDDTAKVTWSAYGPVLSIASNGIATGQTPGDTQVLAILPGFIARADVLVVPVGTFRLIGAVTEAGLPVWNARVTVIAGQGAGLSAMTGSDGTYRLYGIAGTVQVQVTKTGYVPDVKTISVTTNELLDFPDFAQPGTAPTIAGTYTLTLQASNDCGLVPFIFLSTTFPPLPEDARIRTYSASITQSGPRLHVVLSGAEFFLHEAFGNYFEGRFDPDGLIFVLGSPYYYTLTGPDVAERLSSNRVLVMDGWTRGKMSSTGAFHAAFQGTITELPVLSSGDLGNPTTFCQSQNHQFTLTPQTMAAARRR
jgi:hypothetical protein